MFLPFVFKLATNINDDEPLCHTGTLHTRVKEMNVQKEKFPSSGRIDKIEESLKTLTRIIYWHSGFSHFTNFSKYTRSVLFQKYSTINDV